MTTSRRAWVGAASVLLATLALVVLDVVDASLRHWFADHAFTTAVLGGVLVLALTVLIVDRVVQGRQLQDRSRAIAAQAAIVMSQADRSSKSVSSMLDGGGGSNSDDNDGGGDREAAVNEVRTYMVMLLISAPVLIDARLSRTFLEAAQHLAGEFARALAITAEKSDRAGAVPGTADDVPGRLEQAVQRLRAASVPLLQILDLEQLVAVNADEVSSEDVEAA